MLGSTVVSAASSFIILLVVARVLGAAGYAPFAVYWSALFMVVAVLFGVQQESTRGVSAAAAAERHRAATEQGDGPANPARSGSVSVLRFSLVLGAALLLLIALSSPLWARQLLGPGTEAWGVPLAVAIGAYAVVAATNGILAGSGTWGPFALLALLDGVIRLVLIGIVLGFGIGGDALAWAVALPFPISLGIVLFGNLRAITSRSRIPGTATTLSQNVARTIAASVAAAVLINGFPVFITAFARTDQEELGRVILAVTLTRAPILVPLTALQSMLIARFAGLRHGRGRFLTILVLGIGAAAGVLALAAWLWGAPLLRVFFGENFVLAPLTLAGLVAAAGCLGILTATGSAVLAASRHTLFAAGWLLAAAISVALLAAPLGSLELRVVVALVVGPLVGAVVHATALSRDPAPAVPGAEGQERRDGE